MKKLIVFAIIVLVACIFTGCNSCTHTFKNLESDFSELDRDVVVLPETGAVTIRFNEGSFSVIPFLSNHIPGGE